MEYRNQTVFIFPFNASGDLIHNSFYLVCSIICHKWIHLLNQVKD